VPEDQVLQEQLWKLWAQVVVLRSGSHLLRTRCKLLRAGPVVLRTVIWIWRHGASRARGYPRACTKSLTFVTGSRQKTGFSRHLQPAGIRFLFLRHPNHRIDGFCRESYIARHHNSAESSNQK
jgi:hypothetical protein